MNKLTNMMMLGFLLDQIEDKEKIRDKAGTDMMKGMHDNYTKGFTKYGNIVKERYDNGEEFIDINKDISLLEGMKAGRQLGMKMNLPEERYEHGKEADGEVVFYIEIIRSLEMTRDCKNH